MWLKVLLAILALLGYILMWFAVFGKKKDIDNMYTGVSSSLVELIFDLTYKYSLTLVKRILIFLLGLFTAFIFTMGVIFS
ncbi:hypothetical protein [Bacillus methanolicus]|uniref:Putative membrane protein n=1 Tax=Bacillus methanolicus (strain MGA3 / ATCC 53907) TaxID=796606 RepID=I3DTF9_BACMM|nr:hypothetical protein [Bacillus methanolicus]AIE61743.1 putative membrane protein [Bacillus methanolicus MGA3]EIJ77530.1 hypothetical protein MGA3_17572 [Bacillus methanolicus MGA3]